MLEIKQFDTLSYQEIFDTMRNELMKRSAATFYDSDMEIVLIELWALLLDMQNYTLDVNSERMEKEMLRFLLGDLRKRTSAKGILFAKQATSTWLFKHTLFDQIANLPFEVIENTYIQDNEIIERTYIKNGERVSWGKDIVLEKEIQVEITLRAPMEIARPFILCFEIENERISPSSEYKQALLSCVYESNHGACALTFEDETQGFLVSGRLLVFPHKQHCETKDRTGWKLCIKVEDAWYDQAPLLHDIHLNPLQISQQETHATSKIYPIQRTLFIQDALALEGVIHVFVYQDNCYKKISFIEKKGVEGVHIYIPIDYNGEHLLLVLHRKDIEIVGSSNGISSQTISIPYQDIEYMRLMMKQADGWHDVTLFDIDTYQKEQPYGAWYDEQKGLLQFGCGNDFLIPEKGNDNIVFCDLVLSKGRKGNIKEHVLTSNVYEQRYPTRYGEDDESLQDAYKRIPNRMAQSSSLSANDIQNVAQRFPGNALTYVKCIPMKYLPIHHKEKGYAIMLGNTNKLSDRYLSMMKQWLKRQLPLGISIELMQAEKLPISIFVEASFSPNEDEEIHLCLKTWITQRMIGEVVRGVDLIQHLLMHTSIKEVRTCYFYHHNQNVDQFEIPYAAYVVVKEIHLIATR